MKETRREKTLWWVFGILIIAYCLVPVVWIASLSFKSPAQLSDKQFWPSNATWDNYSFILSGGASDLFLPALALALPSPRVRPAGWWKMN